ncbi:helix-turn-helix domain-containing protein [Streptomyces bottropensis]|uniref:helix-turn-helix domain-containing protein n=1 Tax=Streptomyces bottropensis TaxID=42235 RepID=UPI0037FFA768
MNSTPSAAIAAQIRLRRQQLGLNREQVAERCARVGAPQLTQAALTNIETGRPDKSGKRRRDVSVEELLVLARALETSPLLMMFPIGHQEEVEVLPGQSVDTWAGLRWFTGQSRFPTDTVDHPMVEDGTPVPGGRPIKLFEKHHQLITRYHFLTLKTAQAQQEGPEALRQLRAEFEAVEGDLRDVREDMRTLGLAPPKLPEILLHVDGTTLEELAAQIAAARQISLEEARVQVYAAVNRQGRGQRGVDWVPADEGPGFYDSEGKFRPSSE